MRILITGASGFIGHHLVVALASAGHTMISCGRGRQAPVGLPVRAWINVDFSQTPGVDFWLPQLVDVDVVINAVGIIRESSSQTFQTLHVAAPSALFQACAIVGVKRVIQISALGADEYATSEYHRSKKAADDFLRQLPVESVIVQPSLVFGTGGTSAKLFTGLAGLPVIPLIGDGDQRVQPVHIDDVVAGIVALVEASAVPKRVAFVGPQPTTMRAFLIDLRTALGMKPARTLSIRRSLIRLGAMIGGRFPGALLTRETFDMLERGNVADASEFKQLLQRAPREPSAFVQASADARHRAREFFLVPLLRWSIAFVWLYSGVVSLGIYPRADSLALLAQVGISGSLALPVLYLAAFADIALGIAVLTIHRAWIWPLQIALMLGYSAIIAWFLPVFWLHPFGPVIKNVVLLVAMLWLWLWERDR